MPMQEMQFQFLDWEDPPEKEKTTHSNIHAQESPGEENGYSLQYSGLENSMDYSMGSQRVGHD